jgi:hypothetical protein
MEEVFSEDGQQLESLKERGIAESVNEVFSVHDEVSP